MKNLYLLSISIIIATIVAAQTDGPRSAGTFSTVAIPGSNKTWLLPGNVASSDDAYSNFFNISGGIGAYTDYLVATNFGFNLPSGVTVKGIYAEVESADPNGRTSDYRVRIVRNGVIGNTDRSLGVFPSTDTYQLYGGEDDLWGEFWTYMDINSPNFGIAIAAQRSATGGSTGGRIDHIRITVVYDNAFTLPVKLESFDAVKNPTSVVVKWTTSEESNMSHYEIEHSLNGREFNTIHTMASRNNAFRTDYIYSDNAPFNGASYYRLKMVHETGEIKYSSIASVNYQQSGAVDLYPTQVTPGELVNIRGSKNGAYTVQFFSHNGQKLASMTTLTRQLSTLPLQQQRGIIYYRVTDGNGMIAGMGRMLVR